MALLKELSANITNEQNASLTSTISIQECKEAVFDMHPDKSLDGLNPNFFPNFQVYD